MKKQLRSTTVRVVQPQAPPPYVRIKHPMSGRGLTLTKRHDQGPDRFDLALRTSGQPLNVSLDELKDLVMLAKEL